MCARQGTRHAARRLFTAAGTAPGAAATRAASGEAARRGASHFPGRPRWPRHESVPRPGGEAGPSRLEKLLWLVPRQNKSKERIYFSHVYVSQNTVTTTTTTTNRT